jgi:hypothetical protein
MSENDVGYKKPPQKYRFKKGQSGNPRGRPKVNKAKGHLAILDQLLSEKIEIRESGQQKKVTKLEAFLKKMFADTMNGDKSSTKMMLRYVEDISKWKEVLYPNQVDELVVKFVSPKIKYEYEGRDDITS